MRSERLMALGAVIRLRKLLSVVAGVSVASVVLGLMVGCESTGDAVRQRMAATGKGMPLKTSAAYRVGSSDVLSIELRGHQELNKTVVVRPDGMITLVLLDDVYVMGLTPGEIDDKLTLMYNTYIVNADVTVSVVGFNSQRIYVWGQVMRQGDQPYDGELTLLDAVSRAGGPNQRSEPKKVLLTRAGEVYQMNLYNVIMHGDFKENVYLQDGDIIFVPPSDWARVGMALDNVFYPFRNLFAFLFLEKEVEGVLK